MSIENLEDRMKTAIVEINAIEADILNRQAEILKLQAKVKNLWARWHSTQHIKNYFHRS